MRKPFADLDTSGRRWRSSDWPEDEVDAVYGFTDHFFG
jgi:hypothetical protein